MKKPFKSIDAQLTYIKRSMAIKEFIDNGHGNVNLVFLTNEKFKLQFKMIWYPMIVSFINNYGNYMILFDIKWAINDVQVQEFGSINHTCWPSKVLVAQGKNIHNNANNLQPILWMGCHVVDNSQ